MGLVWVISGPLYIMSLEHGFLDYRRAPNFPGGAWGGGVDGLKELQVMGDTYPQ